MRRFVIAAPFLVALTGCDGGFSYRGVVTPSSGSLPANCRMTLQHEGSAKLWDEVTISPPTIEGMFVVAPSEGTYEMTVLCAGYKPYKRQVHYGTETLPDRALELGRIVLVPDNGT